MGGGPQQMHSGETWPTLRSPATDPRVYTHSNSHGDETHPRYDATRKAFYRYGLPFENPQSKSNDEKSIRQIPIEEHSIKHLTGTPQES